MSFITTYVGNRCWPLRIRLGSRRELQSGTNLPEMFAEALDKDGLGEEVVGAAGTANGTV
eukprot:scaffold344278_cov21-Prasinocladus_malaysianus.AAC.1